MKACDSCVSNRVEIGKNYKTMPVWVRAIGMVFIYLPILTLPFIFLSAYLSYYHLLMMGAKDVKTLKDFYGPFSKDVKSKEKLEKATNLGDAPANIKCPKCGGAAVEIDSHLVEYTEPDGSPGEPTETIVYQCEECGFQFDSEDEE